MLTKNLLEQGRKIGSFAPETFIPSLTRNQLIDKIADMFSQDLSDRYGTLPPIDDMDVADVRGLPVLGTAFDHVDQLLSEEGISTDGTVGGIMDALDFSKEDVHALVCECVSVGGGDTSVAGYQLCPRLMKLKRDD